VTATYDGNFLFDPSVSAPASFTISKATSKTSLVLSTARITYGSERVERLKVRVSPQYSGTPTGVVVVRSGSSVVCTIKLASGAGSCRLSPRKLGIGRHNLVAAYRGSGDFSGSTSAEIRLTVVP
jgi:hypothetical protein